MCYPLLIFSSTDYKSALAGGNGSDPSENDSGPPQNDRRPLGNGSGPLQNDRGPSGNGSGPSENDSGPLQNDRRPLGNGSGPQKNEKYLVTNEIFEGMSQKNEILHQKQPVTCKKNQALCHFFVVKNEKE